MLFIKTSTSSISTLTLMIVIGVGCRLADDVVSGYSGGATTSYHQPRRQSNVYGGHGGKSSWVADDNSATMSQYSSVPFAVTTDPNTYMGYFRPSSSRSFSEQQQQQQQQLQQQQQQQQQQQHGPWRSHPPNSPQAPPPPPPPRPAANGPTRYADSSFNTGNLGNGFGENSYGTPDVTYGYNRYPYPWSNDYYYYEHSYHSPDRLHPNQYYYYGFHPGYDNSYSDSYVMMDYDKNKKSYDYNNNNNRPSRRYGNINNINNSNNNSSSNNNVNSRNNNIYNNGAQYYKGHSNGRHDTDTQYYRYNNNSVRRNNSNNNNKEDWFVTGQTPHKFRQQQIDGLLAY